MATPGPLIPASHDTLADRISRRRPPDPMWGPQPFNYSTVSAAALNDRGPLFADLSDASRLLGLDCAIIGREHNAIDVRRYRGEPDEDGVIWKTFIYRDPLEWAKAVLTLAPPQRWTTDNPLR